MASNGCNFCTKVGSQPISNDRTSFNYSCLEVKKKDKNKRGIGPTDPTDQVCNHKWTKNISFFAYQISFWGFWANFFEAGTWSF
jgi:hypothetical protein